MNDQGPSLEPAPPQTDPPVPAPIQATVAQSDIDPFTELAPEIPDLVAPDATFALTPGTDALVPAGATFLLRVPYSILGKIVVRADCAVINYGTTPLIFPAALFLPEVVVRLRDLGVTVVER